MTWSIEDVRGAPLERLLDWVDQRVPTLRQMHAIKELAVRAMHQPDLLSTALSAIGRGLGNASRVGGLPVGYLGAKALFDEGAEARRALLTSLATVSPIERDDLLHWLRPEPAAQPSRLAAISEQELILQSYVETVRLEGAIRDVLRSPAPELQIDVMRLPRQPEAVAMISLSNEHWDELNRRGEQLSAALGTTMYWPPPDDLGPLDPDLRVAVGPAGSRELVVARYTTDGFDVAPYPADANGSRT